MLSVALHFYNTGLIRVLEANSVDVDEEHNAVFIYRDGQPGFDRFEPAAGEHLGIFVMNEQGATVAKHRLHGQEEGPKQ